MSLNDWFRPRRGIVPDTIGDSTEDWRAGDIAVSVGVHAWMDLTNGQPSPGPPKGQLSRVTRVAIVDRRQFLCLAGYGPANVYAASCFKKLRGEADWLERAIRKHRPVDVREPEHA